MEHVCGAQDRSGPPLIDPKEAIHTCGCMCMCMYDVTQPFQSRSLAVLCCVAGSQASRRKMELFDTWASFYLQISCASLSDMPRLLIFTSSEPHSSTRLCTFHTHGGFFGCQTWATSAFLNVRVTSCGWSRCPHSKILGSIDM